MSGLRTAGFSALWLLLAGGLYFYFSGKLSPNTVEKLGVENHVILNRDFSGHYHAEALINDVKAVVLIDTGATSVTISQELANKIGIKSRQAIRTKTANGESVGYMTRLDSVKLGGIKVTNVAATIAPNLSGADALLGMSFLNRMDVRLYKDTMTIKLADSP